MTYADLQWMQYQGREEARKLGHTSIDLAAVEREIARQDLLAQIDATVEAQAWARRRQPSGAATRNSPTCRS